MPFDVVEQDYHRRARERPDVEIRMDQQWTQVLEYVVQIFDLMLQVMTFDGRR